MKSVYFLLLPEQFNVDRGDEGFDVKGKGAEPKSSLRFPVWTIDLGENTQSAKKKHIVDGPDSNESLAIWPRRRFRERLEKKLSHLGVFRSIRS
jgi:hypothetical protein